MLGDLPALRRDPLAFLTRTARQGEMIVPLRLPGLRAFLLLDPQDIERVLVTDHHDFVKPVWLRTPAIRRLLGDGLVTSDGTAWRRQRRVCQPPFLPSRMPGYGCEMAAATERLLDNWQDGQTHDILPAMARLTLEIISQTLLGADITAQVDDIIASLDTLMRCFSAGHSLYGLLPLPPTPTECRAVRRLNAAVDALIYQHSQGPSPTLLSCLREHGSGPQEMREQVKTFLAAGYESSSLALTWAFALLAQHPDSDARLASELNSVLGERAPTPDDLPRLPHTQAIIQETLRLYPPLWMTGRRALHACTLSGRAIPAGALLLLSPWAVQRLPQWFPDPDAFRPERWQSEEIAKLPRFAFFPFGGGPRICIGQGFALMETTLLLATIARRFRLEWASAVDAAALRPWATMTLRPVSAIRLRLAERTQG